MHRVALYTRDVHFGLIIDLLYVKFPALEEYHRKPPAPGFIYSSISLTGNLYFSLKKKFIYIYIQGKECAEDYCTERQLQDGQVDQGLLIHTRPWQKPKRQNMKSEN